MPAPTTTRSTRSATGRSRTSKRRPSRTSWPTSNEPGWLPRQPVSAGGYSLPSTKCCRAIRSIDPPPPRSEPYPESDDAAPRPAVVLVRDDQSPPPAAEVAGVSLLVRGEPDARDEPAPVDVQDLRVLAAAAWAHGNAESVLVGSVQPDVAGRRDDRLDRVAVALDIQDRGAVGRVDMSRSQRRNDRLTRAVGGAHHRPRVRDVEGRVVGIVGGERSQ